ncbi:MAG: hypothetical protein NTY88_00655 [Bacteroidetes bacterium]|nr:hypothetical protein [Bacteroidota bacterium]
MKKIYALLLILLVVAGCNKEKIYKDNLNGLWEVYKYILNNTDKTTQFQTTHPNYTIAFTSDGKFTETQSFIDTTIVNGTYTFEDNDEKIVLQNEYYTYYIDTLYDTAMIAYYDTLELPHTLTRKYTIFNLTKDHVQLRNDTSQLYMDKPKTP